MSRLDVHAHFIPDVYRDALLAAGHVRPDGMPALPPWDAAEHAEMLKRLGVDAALLSISSPGVHLGNDGDARALAREVNEAGRRTVQRFPDRFGLLAALPLPDVGGALHELAHAYDALDVDGVCLLTNTDGTYLSDPDLEPVFVELDRRHARVFIHPTSPPCSQQTSFDWPRPMLEFLFDTTRCVIDLVLRGTVAQYPQIEWIVPHAGAALAVVADRVAAFSMRLPGVEAQRSVLGDLARLHYDLAGFAVPRQLDALLTIAAIDHLHYGSDYPFTPEAVASVLAAQLDEIHRPTPDMLADNTRRLFPKFGPSRPTAP